LPIAPIVAAPGPFAATIAAVASRIWASENREGLGMGVIDNRF
jgi:hypothetical protein